MKAVCSGYSDRPRSISGSSADIVNQMMRPAVEKVARYTMAVADLRREVEAAYSQYWDARAQAVWTLDAAPLDDVATGDEILALRRDVDQLRNDGRAIKVEVQHQFTVIRVDGDVAQVLDRLRDFSIYVDAN